jgi:hypothetical protein
VGGHSAATVPVDVQLSAAAEVTVHAVGTLAPIIDGYIGCIVIRPDGSRQLARAVPDPLA